jgi:hypothetical protein
MTMTASAAGRPFSWVGSVTTNHSVTDYDYNVSAVGGQTLNAKLTTLAGDLTTNADASCATVLAYGLNDIIVLNRTTAQVQGDITTACGLINTEIDTFNAAFVSFIATLKLTYPQVVGADVAPLITNPNDTAQLFDGLHPSVPTYAAMSGVIWAALGPTL